MPANYEWIETALVGIEKQTGKKFHIVDTKGMFRNAFAEPLFSIHRLIITPSSFCPLSGSSLCIECDWANVMERSATQSSPFLFTCKGGIIYLTFPLYLEGILMGALIVGYWLTQDSSLPSEEKSYAHSTEIAPFPFFDPREAEELLPLLQMISHGILHWFFKQITYELEDHGRKQLIKLFFRLRYWNSELNIHQLANCLDLSLSRTSHVLKELFQKSFADMLNEERLLSAQYLLKLSEDPLQLIGQKIGFRDVFYFSRLFHRYFQIAPGEYRKRYGYGKKRLSMKKIK